MNKRLVFSEQDAGHFIVYRDNLELVGRISLVDSCWRVKTSLNNDHIVEFYRFKNFATLDEAKAFLNDEYEKSLKPEIKFITTNEVYVTALKDGEMVAILNAEAGGWIANIMNIHSYKFNSLDEAKNFVINNL